MVLSNSEKVDADRIGEDRLVDDVADHLRMRQEAAVGTGGDVAEGIQPKLEMLCHRVRCSHRFRRRP